MFKVLRGEFCYRCWRTLMKNRLSPTRVVALRCEQLENPIGLDEAIPRFSWRLQDERHGASQTAYELEVSVSSSTQSAEAAWTTGKVASDQSVLVPYAGPALQPHADYTWRVRVWDAEGEVSAWSQPATWRTGFFRQRWPGEWIGLKVAD